MKNKKVNVLLLLIIILCVVNTSYAKSTRIIQINPDLYFKGTTAYCKTTISGNSLEDDIEVIVKLFRGATCVITWRESGKGRLVFSETYPVEKNKTYRLMVVVTINDIKSDPVYVVAKCE